MHIPTERLVVQLDELVEAGRLTAEEAERLRAAARPGEFADVGREVRHGHAMLGLVILALGALASHEALHRLMIHAALVVALLGVVGSIPAAAGLLTGARRPVASIVSLVTALVCAGYLVMGIRSFVAARRATEAA